MLLEVMQTEPRQFSWIIEGLQGLPKILPEGARAPSVTQAGLLRQRRVRDSSVNVKELNAVFIMCLQFKLEARGSSTLSLRSRRLSGRRVWSGAVSSCMCTLLIPLWNADQFKFSLPYPLRSRLCVCRMWICSSSSAYSFLMVGKVSLDLGTWWSSWWRSPDLWRKDSSEAWQILHGGHDELLFRNDIIVLKPNCC